MSGENYNASLSKGNGNRMKKEIKNIPASVRARLLNLAKASKRDFNAVLLQYFQERFLYRLSVSSYRNNFILKGALLFLVYNMPQNRPTKDIDFLGLSITNDEESLLKVIRKITEIKVKDGVSFDIDSLTSEVIKENADYQGVRIYCEAIMGQVRKRFRFDIGFGDIIVPHPLTIDFPTLLPNFSAPQLLVYSPESAIAEKLESITKLNFFTSRMKDFYDIYYLANNYMFKPNLLQDAIETTFKNRGTDLKAHKILYDEKFKADSEKQQQWMAFLNRSKINIDLSFREIIDFIENFIEPLFSDIADNT